MNISLEQKGKRIRFYEVLETLTTNTRVLLKRGRKQIFNGKAVEANLKLEDYFRDVVYSMKIVNGMLVIDLDDDDI